jgi:hypothetical protein
MQDAENVSSCNMQLCKKRTIYSTLKKKLKLHSVYMHLESGEIRILIRTSNPRDS